VSQHPKLIDCIDSRTRLSSEPPAAVNVLGYIPGRGKCQNGGNKVLRNIDTMHQTIRHHIPEDRMSLCSVSVLLGSQAVN
jgi:hypothetical protein